MSARYLLPCPACQQSIPVATSQAGGTVRCECGAMTEAPRLRDLRQLPTEEPVGPPPTVWGPREGAMTALLLAASAFAGAGGWFALQEPAAPPPFDADARQKMVNQGIDQLSPLDAWRMYQGSYLPLLYVGLQEATNPAEAATRQKIAWCRRYRNTWLSVAGVLAVAAVGVAVAVPRRRQASD